MVCDERGRVDDQWYILNVSFGSVLTAAAGLGRLD